MKTREHIYRKEASELLRDLTTYHYMHRDQVLRLYPGKESKIENLLSYFIRQGRIFYDKDLDMYHDGTEVTPDNALITAIWVLIDFINKVEYHSAVDFPAALVFLAEGELFEVIHVSTGKEAAMEHAMTHQGSDAEKRIVIVEDERQISQLEIPNAIVYCTVDIRNGNVRYFKQEESLG